MEHMRKPLPALTAKEKPLGAAYLIFQFTFLPLLLQLVCQAFSPDMSLALYNFLYFFVNFICVTAIFSKSLKKSLLRALGQPEALLFSIGIGFGLHRLCTVVLGLLGAVLFPEFVNLNDSSLTATFDGYPVLMFLSTVLLAPVAEEVLYRGLIFGWLSEKNMYLAYAASTVLFAAVHVAQYIGLYSPVHVLVAFVQYLPAGIFFAWAYHRSGSILAPIAIHVINNFLAFLIVR